MAAELLVGQHQDVCLQKKPSQPSTRQCGILLHLPPSLSEIFIPMPKGDCSRVIASISEIVECIPMPKPYAVLSHAHLRKRCLLRLECDPIFLTPSPPSSSPLPSRPGRSTMLSTPLSPGASQGEPYRTKVRGSCTACVSDRATDYSCSVSTHARPGVSAHAISGASHLMCSASGCRTFSAP